MVASAYLTVQDLKEVLIQNGIESVEKHETRPERIKGGVVGFNLCRDLNTPDDFVQILEERHKEEGRIRMKRRQDKMSIDAYWEYRYATIQIEFVWERLKIAWKLPGPYSARAFVHVGEIVGVKEK